VAKGSAEARRAAYFGPRASTIRFLRTEVRPPAAHATSPSLIPILRGSISRTNLPRQSHWLSFFLASQAAASQTFLNRPWVSVREMLRRSTPCSGPRSKITRICVIGFQFS
jgi:hypothetical protein